MDSISDIFHNPSFKKDFAFVKNLEVHNKEYQDKVWMKFIGSLSRRDEVVKVERTRFESHPSGLSSESNKSLFMEEELKDEPFPLSATSINVKEPKEKNKPSSASKITVSEVGRKKLRKKLTQHLRNGTVDKFEVKDIGDHGSVDRKPKDGEEHKDKSKEIEEVYVDRWRNYDSSSASNISRCSSDTSITEILAEIVDVPTIIPKEPETVPKDRLEKNKNVKEPPKPKIKEKAQEVKMRKILEKKKSVAAKASVELRRSRYYIEKCIAAIKDVGYILNKGIIPPDGSDDYSRRNIRTKEFTSRFSRIFVYPLTRQLSKLNSTGLVDKNLSSYSKFAMMYQLIYKALLSCIKHFPLTVGNNSYHKLKEHLSCTVEVCEKNSKLFEQDLNYENDEYVKILKSQCVELMANLDEKFLSTTAESLLKSKSTRTSLVPVNQHKMLPISKGSSHKRFAMYNTSLVAKRDREWKRLVESMEERKPKVKSRYRTATFKHRPPMERPHMQLMAQPEQHRLDSKRSLVLLRNTPVTTPFDEDSIQTMIQYEKERAREDDSEKEEFEEEGEEQESLQVEKNTTVKEEQNVVEHNKEKQDDILTKLLQLVQNNEYGSADPDNNLTDTIMVLQKCLDFKNQNSELFRKVTNENEKVLIAETNKMVIEDDNRRRQKKEPLITVTGAKNAQLICIKDDNSIASHTSDVEEPIKHKVHYNSRGKTMVSTEVQTSKSHLKCNLSKFKITIGRINRPRKRLRLLPKDYAINVIQYKLAYHKYCKKNRMYKTSQLKPWELMDKISDQLLDITLLAVSTEIEVNELVENIYNAEFQY